MARHEIPLTPEAQSFTVQLGGLNYTLRLHYADAPDGGWLLDMSTEDGDPILLGAPLVTGADILEQFAYLGISGGLVVETDGNVDAVPAYDDLGDPSHLIFVTS